MSRPSEVREPFYFGQEGRRLYGCLHPSPRPRPGAPGILICPPLGQESMRSHRSLIQLAVRLAREGFPAMRFDYFGCGDSAGTLLDLEWADLLADVEVAASELKRRSRTPDVALVGLRIGAAAALLGSGVGARALALWDPMVDGADYLAQLERDHKQMLSNSYVDKKRALRDGEIIERLGYRYPKRLFDQIGGMNLCSELPQAAAAARSENLVLDGGEDPTVERLAAKMNESGRPSRFVRVEGPRVWSEEPYKGLVPAAALDAVLSWADGLAS